MARTKGFGQRALVEAPDTMPFATREAESRFNSLKADKTLAPERGFDGDTFEQGAYLAWVTGII